MIYLGADHGGFELKEKIKKHLQTRGLSFKDLGTYSTESVDYPDYAFAVAERVISSEENFGILVCTTSIGSSIAANKVKGIRAAVGYNQSAVARARNDVNANVLCLGGKEMDHKQALKVVDVFLATPFSYAPRHIRRIGKIRAKEEKER
jgi:ribose 5-phosphate isomerase B